MIKKLLLFVVLVALGFAILKLSVGGSGFGGASRTAVLSEEGSGESSAETQAGPQQPGVQGVPVSMGDGRPGQSVEIVVNDGFTLPKSVIVEDSAGVRHTLVTQRIVVEDSEPDASANGSARQHLMGVMVDFYRVDEADGVPVSVPRVKLLADEAWVELAVGEDGEQTIRSDRQMDLRGVVIQTLAGSSLPDLTLAVGQMSAWSRDRETYLYTASDTEPFTLEMGGDDPMTLTGKGLRIRLPGEADMDRDVGRADVTVVQEATWRFRSNPGTRVDGGSMLEGFRVFSAQCSGRLTYSEDVATGSGNLQMTGGVRMEGDPWDPVQGDLWRATGDLLNARLVRQGRGRAAEARERMLEEMGVDAGPRWKSFRLTGQPARLEALDQTLGCAEITAVAAGDGRPLVIRAAGGDATGRLRLQGEDGPVPVLIRAGRRFDLVRPGGLLAPVLAGYGFPPSALQGLRQRQHLFAVGPATLDATPEADRSGNEGPARRLKAQGGMAGIVRIGGQGDAAASMGSFLRGMGDVEVQLAQGEASNSATPPIWTTEASHGFEIQRIIHHRTAEVVETLVLNTDGVGTSSDDRSFAITQSSPQGEAMSLGGQGAAQLARTSPWKPDADAAELGGQAVEIDASSETGSLRLSGQGATLSNMTRFRGRLLGAGAGGDGAEALAAEAEGSPCEVRFPTERGALVGKAPRVIRRGQGLRLLQHPERLEEPLPRIERWPSASEDGTPELLAEAPLIDLDRGPDPLGASGNGSSAAGAQGQVDVWITAATDRPLNTKRVASIQLAMGEGEASGKPGGAPSSVSLRSQRWVLMPWTVPPTQQRWVSSLLPPAHGMLALRTFRNPRVLAWGLPEQPLVLDLGASGDAQGERLVAQVIQGPEQVAGSPPGKAGSSKNPGAWVGVLGRLEGNPAISRQPLENGEVTELLSRWVIFAADSAGRADVSTSSPEDEPTVLTVTDPAGSLPGGSHALRITGRQLEKQGNLVTIAEGATIRGLDAAGKLDPKGLRLDAGSMVVELDPKTNTIKRLRAGKGVDLDTKDLRAKGDQLILEAETGWATVLAKPGERVWLWMPGLMPAAVHSAKANYRTREFRAWRARLGEIEEPGAEDSADPSPTLQARREASR